MILWVLLLSLNILARNHSIQTIWMHISFFPLENSLQGIWHILMAFSGQSLQWQIKCLFTRSCGWSKMPPKVRHAPSKWLHGIWELDALLYWLLATDCFIESLRSRVTISGLVKKSFSIPITISGSGGPPKFPPSTLWDVPIVWEERGKSTDSGIQRFGSTSATNSVWHLETQSLGRNTLALWKGQSLVVWGRCVPWRIFRLPGITWMSVAPPVKQSSKSHIYFPGVRLP